MIDKVVVVTGASRGIGRAVAYALLEEGARVAGAARDRETLDEAMAAHPGTDEGRSVAVPTDVTDEEEVGRLFVRTVREFGRVDAVVNCAGVLRRGQVAELSLRDWQETLAVNLTGTFLCARQAVRAMRAQEPDSEGIRGHLVHLVSGAGVHGWAGAAAYSASKFGVVGLSESLRAEVREEGIKVTELLPGMVETDMTAHPDFAERNKLEPEDIAAAVVYVLGVPGRVQPTRVDVRHLLPG